MWEAGIRKFYDALRIGIYHRKFSHKSFLFN